MTTSTTITAVNFSALLLPPLRYFGGGNRGWLPLKQPRQGWALRATYQLPATSFGQFIGLWKYTYSRDIRWSAKGDMGWNYIRIHRRSSNTAFPDRGESLAILTPGIPENIAMDMGT
ncbi:MAG TPA: hypothetical protein IGS52_12650 [Oscillatoriaceae cyanobacterium M33_DOE_052]|uniref:Uncharacterized protein n=1 Tax=Planktothricoides sp. SpSt-374 TaxID=2282167 RepID=A0A7C3VLD4_9CYAN|nr:hypothetical protein [Oscillatoriaceae cyanobacterium M33_DOE_052]